MFEKRLVFLFSSAFVAVFEAFVAYYIGDEDAR